MHFGFETWTSGRSSAKRSSIIRSSSPSVSSTTLGLVGDVDDLVRSGVDLEGDGRRAHRLLVEPAVGVELKDDVVAEAAVELRVADRPVLAGGEHEVGMADDLDLAAGEGGSGAEDALVDDAPALAEEIEGRRLLLLAGKLGDVDGAGEALEVPRLVGVAEVEEDLAEGVGRLLLEPVAREPDAEVAAARLQQVVEGARGDPGDLGLRRFLPGCCLGDAHRHRSGRSSGYDARHSMSPRPAEAGGARARRPRRGRRARLPAARRRRS